VQQVDDALQKVFSAQAVTRDVLIEFLTRTREEDVHVENYTTEAALVPFFYDTMIFASSMTVLSQASSVNKTKKMSSATADCWRGVRVETERFYKENICIPDNVRELAVTLAKLVEVVIHQAFDLGDTLDEAAVQDLIVPLEQIFVAAVFQREFEFGTDLKEARNSPHLILQVGDTVMNGHADACQLIKIPVSDNLVDTVVKVEELKAPKVVKPPPAQFSDSYKPVTASASDPAPLNGAHISQCFAEMASIIGRQTVGRPFKLSEIEQSPVRLWGQVTNGVVGVTVRWLGPDKTAVMVNGEHIQVRCPVGFGGAADSCHYEYCAHLSRHIAHYLVS
jgi:hypothetical protein